MTPYPFPKDYFQLADERQRPHRAKKVWAAFTPARSVVRFAAISSGHFDHQYDECMGL
jgi:hypothetical protein